jgi:hypothetical protein
MAYNAAVAGFSRIAISRLRGCHLFTVAGITAPAKFCMTALLGLERSLTASGIVGRAKASPLAPLPIDNSPG